MYIYIFLFFCSCLSGCVAKVSNLVVFGDSYSDVGNRWQSSNGPGWSQDLAAGWNASLYSFAFSGATCDQSVNGTPSIVDQVEMYYHQHLDLPPEETVYAFWVGHDDIHEAIQANKSDYETIIDCILHQIRNVRKVFGSNRYLTFTLAPTENMPYFNEDGRTDERERYSQAFDDFNNKLHDKVYSMVRRHRSLALDLVDTHDLLKDMSNTPADFGFKDGYRSFWDTCHGQCGDAVDDYVWWDKTHLTGGAHRIIANSILMSGDSSVMGDVEGAKSPAFTAKYNTGLMDRLYDELKGGTTNDQQAECSNSNRWMRPLMAFLVLGLGYVAYRRWVKQRGGSLGALAGLVRNRTSDSRLTLLHNIEPSSNSV